MATQVGNTSTGRFYVRNVSKDFIIPTLRGSIREETDKLVDTVVMTAGRNENIGIGDEIEVIDRANDTRRFGGYIVNREETNGNWRVEADEFISETVDTNVARSFRNRSPESIVKELIDDNTSLTAKTPVASDVELTNYIVEGPIEEALKDMTELLEYQIRTTPQREVFFEPRGRLDSDARFVNGDNAIVTNKRTKDSKFINTVELQAGRTNYTEEESFTGDGSQTEFELNDRPTGNIRVLVKGTEQSGAISESLQTGDDFFIKEDAPSLVFACPVASGDNIKIRYSYEVPILVEAQADTDIIPPEDREVSQRIKRKWIKSFDDARQYASEYVNNRANLTGQVELKARYNPSPPQGKLAKVVDPTRNIDGEFVVESKEIKFNGSMRLTLGDPEFNMLDWRHNVQKRIRQLQRRNTTDKTLTKYRQLDNKVDVSFSSSIDIKKREVNDSFIVGHATNGRVDAQTGSGHKQIVIDDFNRGDDF